MLLSVLHQYQVLNCFTLDKHVFLEYIFWVVSEHANFGRGITGIGENICIGKMKILNQMN